MEPQSFIVGLMASISAFGGSILVAMIVLERPRYGLRCWPRLVSNGRLRLGFARQVFRPRTSQQWLEADDPQARSRERAVLERIERRRAKRRRQGSARKHNPANKA